MSVEKKLILKILKKIKRKVRFLFLRILRALKLFWIYMIYKLKFNEKFFDKKERFVRVHINSGNIYKDGYLNINFRLKKTINYLCSAGKLPLFDQSAEVIEMSNVSEYLSQEDFLKALREWWRVLIPGGKLAINDNDCMKFKKLIEKHGFGILKEPTPKDAARSQYLYTRITAYKSLKHLFKEEHYDQDLLAMRESKRPETMMISWWEKHIFNRIFLEFEEQLFKDKKVIDLRCGSGEKDIILARKGHDITGIDSSVKALEAAKTHKAKEGLDNMKFVNASLLDMPFADKSFDSGLMIEVLAQLEPACNERVFQEIKRVLKPEGQLLITVANKFAYVDQGHVQIFTKGLLVKLLDSQGLYIDFLECETRKDVYREHDMLKALCTNRPAKKKNGRRICAVGAYDIRYDYLGFHWDGQARAFQELGYETLLLNVRGSDYNTLREEILKFQPDILWLGLKECLPFVKFIEKDMKAIQCKVIYWFCDLRGIEGIKGDLPLKPPVVEFNEFKGVLDFVFLSNYGQVEDYKKITGIENVFYMGRSCSKAFHRRVSMKENFDIAFAGGMDRSVFHRERTALIKKMSKLYNVTIRNDAMNHISEFYSSAKIAFGADVIDEGDEFQPYLYTSNRLFIALACGACYVCQWFPGIEKLAENHKHLVWFKEEKELFEQLDYYLKNDKARETIRRNAQAWAYGAHTHLHRVENILDIIDEKTKNFYGFLE